jgi:hypothetical protein
MRNKHNVPKKTWNKWNHVARYVFNQTYGSVLHGSDVLFPPAASALKRPSIKVIAWNTAWVAADAVREISSVK